MSHAPIRITAEPAWGWCAGLRHPPRASYPAGFFSLAQLAELRADPALTLEDAEPEAPPAPPAPPANVPEASDPAGAGDQAARVVGARAVKPPR